MQIPEQFHSLYYSILTINSQILNFKEKVMMQKIIA